MHNFRPFISFEKKKLILWFNVYHYMLRFMALWEPWERCMCAVCAPWVPRKHSAATSCALYECHGPCKDAVGTSCGRCRDAEGALYARVTGKVDELNKSHACFIYNNINLNETIYNESTNTITIQQYYHQFTVYNVYMKLINQLCLVLKIVSVLWNRRSTCFIQ